MEENVEITLKETSKDMCVSEMPTTCVDMTSAMLVCYYVYPVL
jgi:hypothetical protein